MFNPEVKEQLRGILNPINQKVVILYFSEGDDETITATKEMITDLISINGFLSVEHHSLDSDEAKKYEIEENGTIVILNEDRVNRGVYYYGPPAGYEINSFVHSLLDFGGVEKLPDAQTLEKIKAIDKDIDIKVFVGLSCPHCPGAVINAHTLAKHNPRIKGIMVEAASYEELSKKFNISSVPRIIINDGKGDLLGNLPMSEILDAINKI